MVRVIAAQASHLPHRCQQVDIALDQRGLGDADRVMALVWHLQHLAWQLARRASSVGAISKELYCVTLHSTVSFNLPLNQRINNEQGKVSPAPWRKN